MTMNCEQACCLLLRGKVYIQAAGELPRLVGNSSRLGLAHVKSTVVPLDGSAFACDPFDGMTVNLSLKCIDLSNLRLGLHGQGAQKPSSKHTEIFALPSILNPGDLLPFTFVADTKTVKIELDWLNTNNGQKFRTGIEYDVTDVGIEILRCVYVPQIAPSNSQMTVTYTSIDAVETMAGEGGQRDVKLIYKGANGFDGSPAILVVPQVRFDPIDNIEMISDSEMEIVISGDIIPQSTSPKWYSLVRPSYGC